MSKVYVPDLGDGEEAEGETPQVAAAALPLRRGKSLLTIALEVVLITAGVFLGLMGEQWRQRSEEQALAQESLRRFRTEIAANRKAVDAVKDYHALLKGDLDAYFKPGNPSPSTTKVRMTRGVGPVFFERAAWDLALATGALAHIETDLGFALSRVYTVQQSYAAIQTAIVPTIYARTGAQDSEGFLRSIHSYVGDLAYFDPTILKQYDEVLTRLDRTLGETPAP